jgi:hypothetical protein
MQASGTAVAAKAYPRNPNLAFWKPNPSETAKRIEKHDSNCKSKAERFLPFAMRKLGFAQASRNLDDVSRRCANFLFYKDLATR